ncbi:MAG TPA: sensor histidine kinase [Chondromyces sp.]|nr:sensor histidine kinase [Chondromyces sp.]
MWKTEVNIDDLMKTYIFGLPAAAIFIGLPLVLSLITAFVIGSTVDIKLSRLDTALKQIENGSYTRKEHSTETVQTIRQLWERVNKIDTLLIEQARASQKLTAERAEVNAQVKEELLLQERHRLARELHDSVSQQLFAASMLLSALTEQHEDLKQLQLVEKMVQEAQLEMRALLLQLRPVQLKDKTIKEGMEELLADLSSKVRLSMTWQIDEVTLNKGTEDHLFRIAQESLSNTLRHAEASLLEIRLKRFSDFVMLRMIDDGVGFQVNEEKLGSYGLQNIQERVYEIGGTIKILSLPDKGTTIEVKVPIIHTDGEGE